MNLLSRLTPALLLPLTLAMSGCANSPKEDKHRVYRNEQPTEIDARARMFWAADPAYRPLVTTLPRADQLPKVTFAPPMRHPTDPRIGNETAAVIVTFLIDEQGSVEAAKILMTSNTRYNQSALDFIKGHKFQPAMKNGRPIKSFMKRSCIFLGPNDTLIQTKSA